MKERGTYMLRSLFSGVAGLKTHQARMDVIGNNIANVNTYGFKSSRVTFKDVYYQTLSNPANASGNLGGTNAAQIGYGSSVGTVDLLNTRSGFASTGKDTDCYIGGEGYFVIKDAAGKEHLTQVGQMDFDGSGNLVDGAGGFVCGYPVAYTSDKVSINNTTIDFGKANGDALNGYKVLVKYADAGTESTVVSANTADKTITITYTPPTADPTKKLTNTALQTALQSWTTPPAGVTDVTAIQIQADDMGGSVTATDGLVAKVATYDTTKQPQKIVNTYGQLNEIAIGPDGSITGKTAAGEIVEIGQIALANVPNPQALVLEGGSYFSAGNNAGTVTYAPPGMDNLGQLKTGGLEMSNVDLSNEFSDMIMTQRGFQASSKMITVSDEILETLVNLKR